MFIRPRVIPCLLLDWDRLIKTIKFKQEKYIWDPINAVKLFNEKEVDELFFIDRSATKRWNINTKLLKRIAVQSFMPLWYAWWIKNFQDAKEIFSLWFEKISLNNSILENQKLISEISSVYWSQSTIITIDVKKNIFWKYRVYNHLQKKCTKICPLAYIKKLEKLWAGEIIINSVNNDWTMEWYDINFLNEISQLVNIPVVSLWWAWNLEDIKEVIDKTHVSAVWVWSLFIYYNKNRAVLINYPNADDLDKLLKK